MIRFDNSYATLPDRFYTRMDPTPVAAPTLLFFNENLAASLGVSVDPAHRAAWFAGNHVPEGAAPLAQVYAGHQFGGFSPQLGDGRAILLGEVIDLKGIRRDIQLKGSGPTPYSRRGDGRAWIGPVLREYIVSEAMHAMGVPTTRALAAVATGEVVLREAPMPGAVLTRVASSHIRVGTFQFFAARQDVEALRVLTDYVIQRHYPEAGDALGLLDAVVGRQVRLVAQWMGLGFVHGVMNTDNTQIAGETIDYGPCAFLEAFDPTKVFSSIDHYGRYAFNRQPEILSWNLAQFATTLLPLIAPERDRAVAQAQAVIETFPARFQTEWGRVFRAKLGLTTEEDKDLDLIESFLRLMYDADADFTNTFRSLGAADLAGHLAHVTGFEAWQDRWRARQDREPPDPRARIVAANPAVIPRNHRIEAAIQAAIGGDLAPARALLEAVADPFSDPKDNSLMAPAQPNEMVTQTFCGT